MTERKFDTTLDPSVSYRIIELAIELAREFAAQDDALARRIFQFPDLIIDSEYPRHRGFENQHELQRRVEAQATATAI